MFQNIWQLRERIAEALLRNGFVYKYDVSLPHDQFYEIIPLLKEKLKGTDAEIVSGYGHLGKPSARLLPFLSLYCKAIYCPFNRSIFQITHVITNLPLLKSPFCTNIVVICKKKLI